MPLFALASRIAATLAIAAALSGVPSASASTTSRLDEAYGRVPLAFEPNRGQAAEPVRFIAAGRGYRILLTDAAVVVALGGKDGVPRALAMRFEGASESAAFVPEKTLASRSHYFQGNAAPVTDVPHFAAVRRDGIYPGVDVVFYGNQRRLEYDLIVAPGADPAAIRLSFAGAVQIVTEENGDLVLRSPAGDVIQQRPRVYQEFAGKRRKVGAAYVVEGSYVTFRLEDYDRSRPLVIDPVLAYGSGEGGVTESNGIVVDASGNAFVAGSVFGSSSTFQLVNAYDTRIGRSDMDAYVQKFNAAGTALIYSTYIGGATGSDQALGIAIDAAGNAFVTGTTSSNDFPVAGTPYQPASSAGGSFILKLAPAGNSLVYSTYLLNATVTGIAVDSQGNAHVTGTANTGFATTTTAYQRSARSSSGNPFVFKLSPAGSAAVYSTFIGGSATTDKAYGIALDPAGNAYIAGATTSIDFPTTAAAYRATSAGAKDAFVTKLNAAGSALVYSTYLGGSQNDYATAIAVDAAGSAYVTGSTFSFDFPVLNAFQPQKGGAGIQGDIDNAFLTKLSPGGHDIDYSSFLGGNACIGPGSSGCLLSPPVDIGMSVAVDPSGNAYIGGQTQSITFPRVNSLRGPVSSNGDAAFVAKVSKLGGVLLYSTLIGGTEGIGNPTDWVRSLAADGSGNVFGTGSIAGFPTTPGPFQSSGGSVVFKLASGAASLSLSSSANPTVSGQNITLTASVGGGTLTGDVLFVAGTGLLGSATIVNGTATLTRSFPAGIHGVTAIFRGVGAEIESPVVYLVTNPAAACN